MRRVKANREISFVRTLVVILYFGFLTLIHRCIDNLVQDIMCFEKLDCLNSKCLLTNRFKVFVVKIRTFIYSGLVFSGREGRRFFPAADFVYDK